MIRRALPHLCLVGSIMMLTFIVIDFFQPGHAFHRRRATRSFNHVLADLHAAGSGYLDLDHLRSPTVAALTVRQLFPRSDLTKDIGINIYLTALACQDNSVGISCTV